MMTSKYDGKGTSVSVTSTSKPGPSSTSVHTAVSVVINLAGNGHSTNGSAGSEMPKRSQKRVRRPDSWKRNIAKAKRAKGEEYTSPFSERCMPRGKLEIHVFVKRNAF